MWKVGIFWLCPSVIYLYIRMPWTRSKALKQVKPDFARSYQEAGHIYKAQGIVDKARVEYQFAIERNPALLSSWRGILQCASQDHDAGLIDRARSYASFLHSLPNELLSAMSMMHEGHTYKAETLCRHFLQNNPRHVEAMRLLATMAVQNGVLADAELLLAKALEFEPEHHLARLDYIGVLYKRQKFKQSLQQSKILLAKNPDSPTSQITYANQNVALGNFDEAMPIFAAQAKKQPNNHALFLSQGHALKTIASVDESISAYRNAYRARPDFGDAFWSLANLKTYQFENSEVLSMLKMEKHPHTSTEDRIHFCFSLGKHYEDKGEYEQSFRFYERGNRLRTQQLQYQPQRMSDRMRFQREFFTSEFCHSEAFRCICAAANPSKAPIFIVGLPRAGSTLLEQILASHSLVDGTMELHNIAALAHVIDGRNKPAEGKPLYPFALADYPLERFQEMGDYYLSETQTHRSGAPYFIDKMPNNFRHIGLIKMILPNAKVIDARRPPMSCCFSNFKQLFSSGQEFTYSLESIGQYYRDYIELMDHWDQVIPGFVLCVQYQDVVHDLEAVVKRLLDFCDLPFEQNCIDFYQTKRSIRTPSSEQVRQPIYQSGLEQWKHFQPWLAPLEAILKDSKLAIEQ